MSTEENKKKIKKLLVDISSHNSKNDKSGYYQDKTAIKFLFELTRKGLDESKVRIRLTVLDSMYSTQMRMHPYGLEYLAKAIWEKLYNNNGDEPENTLKKIATGGTGSCDEADKIYNLFEDEYGVDTNRAKAVSLISKYFYFETDCKFPIYDSIVREYLPILYRYCGDKLPKAIPVNDIKQYIKTINDFFDKIDYTRDGSRYDSLDHLLWVIGKILRGNLSLVLDARDYQTITEQDTYQRIEPNKNKASFAFIKKNISDYEGYINGLINILPDGDLNKKMAKIALNIINDEMASK